MGTLKAWYIWMQIRREVKRREADPPSPERSMRMLTSLHRDAPRRKAPELRELCIRLSSEAPSLAKLVVEAGIGREELESLWDKLASQGMETVIHGRCGLVEVFSRPDLFRKALRMRDYGPRDLTDRLDRWMEIYGIDVGGP